MKTILHPGTGEPLERMSVTIDKSLIDAIDILAADQHRSRSNMVTLLIRHGLVAEAYALMEQRGLQLGKDAPDPYVNELLAIARHGREARTRGQK